MPADAAPALAADGDRVAVLHAPVTRRQRRHQAGEVAGTSADLLQRLGVAQPVRGEEARGALAAEGRGALGGQAGRVIVGRADPHAALVLRRAPALAQPLRQADVVRVHVRHQHAQHGQAVQLVGEDLFPLRLRFVARDAAIDHRPAFAPVEAVAQQPQVDVVQRERKGHPDPAHAGRECDGGAGGRQGVAQRVLQFAFEEVHGRRRTVTLTLT